MRLVFDKSVPNFPDKNNVRKANSSNFLFVSMFFLFCFVFLLLFFCLFVFVLFFCCCFFFVIAFFFFFFFFFFFCFLFFFLPGTIDKIIFVVAVVGSSGWIHACIQFQAL